MPEYPMPTRSRFMSDWNGRNHYGRGQWKLIWILCKDRVAAVLA